MLPSKGYFKSFNCPFYENGVCDRPHCHYRHTKKEKIDYQNACKIQTDGLPQENKSLPNHTVDKVTVSSFSKAVEKILREDYLNNSEFKKECKIVKDNVSKLSDDLSSAACTTYTNNLEIPCYKPTPISELNRRHIPVAYPPNRVTTVIPKSKSLVKKTKIEYVPQSENGKEPKLPVNYSPTPSSQITKVRSQEYLPAGSNWNHTYTPSKIIESCLYNQTAASSKPSTYLLDGMSSPLYSSGISQDNYEYVFNELNVDITSDHDYGEKKNTNCRSSTLYNTEEDVDDDLDLDDISPELDMLGAIVDSEMQDSEEDFVTDKLENMETDNISVEIENEIPNIISINVDTEIPEKNIVTNSTEINSKEIYLIENLPKSSNISDDLCETNEVQENIVISKSEKIKDSSKHKSKHKGSSHCSSNYKSVEKHRSSSVSNYKLYDKLCSKGSLSKERHPSSSLSSSTKEKSRSHLSTLSSKSKMNPKNSHDQKNKLKSFSNHNSSSIKHKNSSDYIISPSKNSSHKKDKQSNGENNVSSNSEKTNKRHKSEKGSNKKKRSESHLRDTAPISLKASSKCNLKRKSLDHHASKVKKQKKEEIEFVTNSNSSSDVEEIIPHTDIVVIDSDSDKECSHTSKHDIIVDNENVVSDDGGDGENNNDYVSSDGDLPFQESETPFTLESESEPVKHYESLPAVKEKKRIAHSNAPVSKTVSLVSLQRVDPGTTLIKRWQKVVATTETEKSFGGDESATNKAPGGKVRIAHVPNVSSILNAKKNILLGSKNTSFGVSQRFQNAKSNSFSTTSSAISSAPADKKIIDPPLVAEVRRSCIPFTKRQVHLHKIFFECLNIYNEEVAKLKAVQMEKECCEKSNCLSTYVNKVLHSLVSLKKVVSNLMTGNESKVAVEGGTKRSSKVYEFVLKFIVPSEELVKHSIPINIESSRALDEQCCAYIDIESLPEKTKKYMRHRDGSDKFICINCSSDFTVNEKGFSVQRKCKFHPINKLRLKTGKCGRIKYYECCNSEEASGGCTVNEYHVRELINYKCIPGFRQTLPAPVSVDCKNYGVFALDCEMCFTTIGQELGRVTIIDENKEVVYDKIVKTQYPVVDYCTSFSGLTEDAMKKATKTLIEVQNELLQFIYAESILIGHGIGNDLKVLKLIHTNVIDTTVLFPHPLGFPYKRRLADITKDVLGRLIQTNESGHDSKEDALACMDLVLHKVESLRKLNKPRKIIEYTGKK